MADFESAYAEAEAASKAADAAVAAADAAVAHAAQDYHNMMRPAANRPFSKTDQRAAVQKHADALGTLMQAKTAAHVQHKKTLTARHAALAAIGETHAPVLNAACVRRVELAERAAALRVELAAIEAEAAVAMGKIHGAVAAGARFTGQLGHDAGGLQSPLAERERWNLMAG